MICAFPVLFALNRSSLKTGESFLIRRRPPLPEPTTWVLASTVIPIGAASTAPCPATRLKITPQTNRGKRMTSFPKPVALHCVATPARSQLQPANIQGTACDFDSSANKFTVTVAQFRFVSNLEACRSRSVAQSSSTKHLNYLETILCRRLAAIKEYAPIGKRDGQVRVPGRLRFIRSGQRIDSPGNGSQGMRCPDFSRFGAIRAAQIVRI
jgi:hypothetical protein